MTSILRLSALRERLRSSLWTWPAVAVVLAIVAGTVLPAVEGAGGTVALGFAGTADGARAVLATVAGSTITVTGLIFSLTVVALQVASSQFTPRILVTFLANRGNRAVLSVFLGTFVYALAVLRSVRSASASTDEFVPDVAVAVGLVLTLLSVGMLVYFFHHITDQLRVESVLADVEADALALVRRQLPAVNEPVEVPAAPTLPPEALVVRALRSGSLQTVDIDLLTRAATDHGLVVRLRPVVGTHVTQGTTLAWAWPAVGTVTGAVGHGTEENVDLDELTRRIHGCLHLGRERTLQQDLALGIRQLVDIAARAESPGVNDPTTAVMSLGSLATVLAELAVRPLVPIVGTDDNGAIRAFVPQPTFAELLALACDQPRRYGASEPAVLEELLHLLTDLAEVSVRGDVRAAIRSQIDATKVAVDAAELGSEDRRRVLNRVRLAFDSWEHRARVPLAETRDSANTPAT